jgi:hypothetical protein
VAANDEVDLPSGDTTMHVLPKEIAEYALDPPDWRRLSAGDGAKRPRLYDWTLVPLAAPSVAGFEQALLIRRPLDAYLAVVRSRVPGAALKGGRSWRNWPNTAS